MYRHALLLTLLAAPLAATAHDPYALAPASLTRSPITSYSYEPYALVQPAPRSPVHDTASAYIVAIDDIHVRAVRAEPMLPGLRRIEVSVPGPRGMGSAVRRTLV